MPIQNVLGKQERTLGAMDNCLQSVSRMYQETESQILQQEEIQTKITAQENASVKEAWDDFAENLGLVELINRLKDRWKRYQEQEAQKKRDKALAKNIKNIIKEDYSKKEWKKATVEERKQMLRELFQDLNEEMGIDVEDIDFNPIEAPEGYITYGYLSYASDGTMNVVINEDLLSDPSNYDVIMDTMVHEMRHGYQHSVVDHPERFEVNEETVESWRNNFNDYQTTEEDGFDAYRDQPVESDARSFAGMVI